MIKILKGHIIHTPTKNAFEVHEDSYIIIEDEKVVGIYSTLPVQYREHAVVDYGSSIIMPSFIDLHLHAPQYMQMGLGLDLELIDWLDQYTFVLEGRFADVNYAKKVYPYFVNDLYEQGTLRFCIFGTSHDEANRHLIACLKEKGLSGYVGKVNMDRNAPDSLIQTAECSLRETEDFIKEFMDDTLVKPIITPRFAPTCTDGLLQGLGQLSVKYHVPVQSHLAENRSEVKWVKTLFPESTSYTDVYVKHQLYGPEKTLMAHSIYLDEDEIEQAKSDVVYMVHCPNSNMNLSSGIMPVTEFLDAGITVGLGSDIGGGHSLAMQETITAAIQCSKMRHVINPKERVLSESEGFYMATKVNGRFFDEFGLIGSFEPGYQFDALVIKDPNMIMDTLKPIEQLQRFLYCGGIQSIRARYLNGKAL